MSNSARESAAPKVHNAAIRKLFMSINDNDLETFKKMITDPVLNLDLTQTDHAESDLETLLGGNWRAFEGSFGRYEDNTPLNFALSLERVEFVAELIRLHRFNGRDIGLNQSNGAGISPLQMAMMVNGEFAEYYNSRHVVDLLKLYTPAEQKANIEKTRGILAYIMQNIPTLPYKSILSTSYRTMVQPQLMVDFILFINQKFSKDPQATKLLPLAVQNMLSYCGLKNRISEEIKELERAQTYLQSDEKKRNSDETKKNLEVIKVNIEKNKKRLPAVEDYQDKLKLFVNLMREDNFLNGLLALTLRKPKAAWYLISPIGDMRKPQVLYGDRSIYEEGDVVPYLDHLRKDINEIVDPTQKEKGLALIAYLKQSGERLEQKASPPAPQLKFGKLGVYWFRGQHRSPVQGRNAASCIAVTLSSELLKMSDAEFGRMLSDPVTAQAILTSRVLAGTDLNTEIHAGSIPVQDVLTLVEEKGSKKFGAQMVQVVTTGLVRLQESAGDFPAFSKFREDTLIELQKTKPWMKDKDVFYVILADKKTFSLFTRNGNIYLIDTANKRDTMTHIFSSIECFDSWESAEQVLKNVWKKEPYADVAVIATKQKLAAELKEEKEEKIAPNVQQSIIASVNIFGVREIDPLATIGLKAINDVIRSAQQGLFGSSESAETIRAKTYKSLLTDASDRQSSLEGLVYLYALLENPKAGSLRLAVAHALDFRSADTELAIKKAILQVRAVFFAALKLSYIPWVSEKDTSKPERLFDQFMKEIINPINQNVNKGFPADDKAYDKIKGFFDSSFVPRSSPASIKLSNQPNQEE